MATKPKAQPSSRSTTQATKAPGAQPKAPAARRVPARPPKGAPAGPAKTLDMAALKEAFAQPRRAVLTRDTFLRSQGPSVVEIDLPNMGCTALMRRLDLLELARRGGEHWPLRSAVLKMIQKGGLDDEATTGEALAETLDVAAAVALTAIVAPPAAYLEAAAAEYQTEAEAKEAREASLQGLRAGSLKPFFVAEGEEPGEGQVVLRWFVPTEDDEPAEGSEAEPAEDAGDAGHIHWADLIVILRMAHQFGPGALGRRFRREEPEADALAALLALAGAGGPKA